MHRESFVDRDYQALLYLSDLNRSDLGGEDGSEQGMHPQSRQIWKRNYGFPIDDGGVDELPE